MTSHVRVGSDTDFRRVETGFVLQWSSAAFHLDAHCVAQELTRSKKMMRSAAYVQQTNTPQMSEQSQMCASCVL